MSLVSLKTLDNILTPFSQPIWGEVVSKKDVQEALDEKRLISDANSQDHAGRIAYFVVNEPQKPISIDVGIDDFISTLNWIIDDGNHRLCGSIFAGREYIEAEISGNCDLIEEIFGKDAVLDE
jgi:hypothetical protein